MAFNLRFFLMTFETDPIHRTVFDYRELGDYMSHQLYKKQTTIRTDQKQRVLFSQIFAYVASCFAW